MTKQQRRSASGNNPPVDFSDFEIGINRFIDDQQLIFAAEDIEKITQVVNGGHTCAPEGLWRQGYRSPRKSWRYSSLLK